MKRQLRSIIVYGIIIVIFILAIIGTLVLDGNGAQSLIFQQETHNTQEFIVSK